MRYNYTASLVWERSKLCNEHWTWQYANELQ